MPRKASPERPIREPLPRGNAERGRWSAEPQMIASLAPKEVLGVTDAGHIVLNAWNSVANVPGTRQR